MITAGVDEVGRGCLAGPVVSAAVILKKGIDLTFKWYLNNLKYYSSIKMKDATKRIGLKN